MYQVFRQEQVVKMNILKDINCCKIFYAIYEIILRFSKIGRFFMTTTDGFVFMMII